MCHRLAVVDYLTTTPGTAYQPDQNVAAAVAPPDHGHATVVAWAARKVGR